MESKITNSFMRSILIGVATLTPINAFADAKISQMPEGGTVQTTDQVPINRGGVNYHVEVGSAATQSSSAFLQPANNLGDVGNASTARGNLGLGTSATQNLASFLQPVNNLSDVSSVSAALNNILPVQTGNAGKALGTNGTTALWLTLAASATTDTTNAANISSGTLPAARLPNPSASSLGGIQSIVVAAHNFLTGISTSGVPAQAQPAFTDISGSVAPSQLPNPSASTLGGIQSLVSTTHQWINAISTAGVPSSTQPAFTDISGNISVNQMNGGTSASSSTVWYGDGTWKIPSGGSSVSVTATTPDLVVTPSPGTGTFTVGTEALINAQGTAASYTILASDMSKTVTHSKSTAVSVSLPAATTSGFGAGTSFTEINIGAGAVTITPTTSTINGASSLVLNQNQAAWIISDGTNYVAFLGSSGGGSSISVTAASPNILISPSPGTGTFTVGATNPINAQGSASSYTILSSDMGKTVTHNSSTAVSVTLAQAITTGFTSGAAYTEFNLGTGVVTITPTTSTINGASTFTLNQNQGVFVISDGTNYIGLPLSNSGSSSGTVTMASVVSANGFAGTVVNPTTTPAFTLTTTVTGLIKGNGTGMSPATSGTDYAPASSGSSILSGNGSGGFSNVTIGTGLSFSAGTLSATGGGSVSVTAATPNIVITPSPGTGTFTVGATQLINAQGTAVSYTVLSTDMGKTVTHSKTTAVAVSLPAASTTGFGAGAAYTEQNLGAGAVTITPTTSTINGLSSLILNQYESAYFTSDGTNYIAFVSKIPTQFLSFQTGPINAATTGKAAFAKVSKSSTVDNIEGSALTFTCSGNPTITMYECGTSTTCATPTTIGSATVTAACTVVDGTVSNPTVTAGDYVAWAITAGTCSALNLSGIAQMHAN